MLSVLLGATAHAQTSQLLWSSLGLNATDGIPRSGATLTSSGGGAATADVSWTTVTDGGTFVPYTTNPSYNSTDFVDYRTLPIGGDVTDTAYLNFDNSLDDPDDKIIMNLTFSEPLYGLTFAALDVDSGDGQLGGVYETWDDAIEVYFNGINVKNYPQYYSFGGTAVGVDNESYMEGFEGQGIQVPSADPDSNVYFDFGSTPITSLEIRYFSTDDPYPQNGTSSDSYNAVGQFIAISSFNYNNVPEPSGILLFGIGATCLLLRRSPRGA